MEALASFIDESRTSKSFLEAIKGGNALKASGSKNHPLKSFKDVVAVPVLEDCEAAEQHCAEIGRSDAYMQLLDMYLDPPDGRAPMLNAAVCLLHNYGEALDPLQVLEKLSPEMPLHDTVLRILRARVHNHHQGQALELTTDWFK